ncbi:MAG TPA: lipoyl(octanoyl) transferase LipB [Thermoanaerobaculia bacterium]|jgi:lipoyl(octanoyl) transferase|nr:lipoyl(octanoyl) transferase LipB [Thermoanaerobaculia bacterium]
MEAVDLIRPAGGAMPATRRVEALWLGRIGYEAALALQTEAAARVARGGAETLLLLEHDPVFTLGRNASEADVLFTPAKRDELGISLFEADRGGKVTYHGPGQLVGYPILNLDPDRRDVRRYVRDLEEVLLGTLADFGVSASRSTLPERVSSVWIGNDKIAAIGVHISRWITTHGFALNVTDEPLSYFRGIVPCGISDGGVTSVSRALGRPVAVRDVVPKLCARFAEVFGREISVAGP